MDGGDGRANTFLNAAQRDSYGFKSTDALDAEHVSAINGFKRHWPKKLPLLARLWAWPRALFSQWSIACLKGSKSRAAPIRTTLTTVLASLWIGCALAIALTPPPTKPTTTQAKAAAAPSPPIHDNRTLVTTANDVFCALKDGTICAADVRAASALAKTSTLAASCLAILSASFLLWSQILRVLAHLLRHLAGGHVLVAGGSALAEQVARQLAMNKDAKRAVILVREKFSQEEVNGLAASGVLAVAGRPFDPSSLRQAGLKRVGALLALSDSDGENLRTAEAARRLRKHYSVSDIAGLASAAMLALLCTGFLIDPVRTSAAQSWPWLQSVMTLPAWIVAILTMGIILFFSGPAAGFAPGQMRIRIEAPILRGQAASKTVAAADLLSFAALEAQDLLHKEEFLAAIVNAWSEGADNVHIGFIGWSPVAEEICLGLLTGLWLPDQTRAVAITIFLACPARCAQAEKRLQARCRNLLDNLSGLGADVAQGPRLIFAPVDLEASQTPWRDMAAYIASHPQHATNPPPFAALVLADEDGQDRQRLAALLLQDKRRNQNSGCGLFLLEAEDEALKIILGGAPEAVTFGGVAALAQSETVLGRVWDKAAERIHENYLFICIVAERPILHLKALRQTLYPCWRFEKMRSEAPSDRPALQWPSDWLEKPIMSVARAAYSVDALPQSAFDNALTDAEEAYDALTLLQCPSTIFLPRAWGGAPGERRSRRLRRALARTVLYKGGFRPGKGQYPWPQLDHPFVASSKAQALHLRLKSIWMKRMDAQDPQWRTQTRWHIACAEAEHNRWMAERFFAGWRAGLLRNNETLHHPELRPYAAFAALCVHPDLNPKEHAMARELFKTMQDKDWDAWASARALANECENP